MIKISFVVPCYNCEKFISHKFLKLKKKLNKSKLKYEIILINDGSNDDTQKKLNLIKEKNKAVKILNNKTNIGKSFSTIKAIKNSIYKNIIIIDCDLPYFNSLDKIINGLKNGYDLVLINRKLKESKMVEKKINLYQSLRYIIGRLIAYLNLRILDIHVEGGDTQAGLKGFKKNKYFESAKFISKKFFFDLELVLIFSKRNLNILSVRTNFSIPKKSTIKIFNFSKNFIILKELISVMFKYK